MVKYRRSFRLARRMRARYDGPVRSRSASFLVAGLRAGRAVLATVAGHSMWPALRAGDRVRIGPVPAGFVPAPGDVVAVAGQAGIVVHRVIAAAGGRVSTWGDGAAAGDRPVRPEDIVGRVVGYDS
jgi:signal peptidase I